MRTGSPVTPFSQQRWACRCEWGAGAPAALAPADVIIVVDVFSFTTCVDVAVSRGAAILPYAWNDASAVEFARTHGAELGGKRRQARYSLAPESYLDAPDGLRCVLPSPIGAQVTLAAARSGSVVLAGSLRNAAAVAAAARRIGRTFNVIPSGERWLDGSLRPSLEDWLGAGAVLSELPGDRSPEAEAAVSLFDTSRTRVERQPHRATLGRRGLHGMERMNRINPAPFVLLLIIGIGNLVRYSKGFRAVDVVGLSGGGFAIGIAVCALAMAFRERRRT